MCESDLGLIRGGWRGARGTLHQFAAYCNLGSGVLFAWLAPARWLAREWALALPVCPRSGLLAGLPLPAPTVGHTKVVISRGLAALHAGNDRPDQQCEHDGAMRHGAAQRVPPEQVMFRKSRMIHPPLFARVTFAWVTSAIRRSAAYECVRFHHPLIFQILVGARPARLHPARAGMLPSPVAVIAGETSGARAVQKNLAVELRVAGCSLLRP